MDVPNIIGFMICVEKCEASNLLRTLMSSAPSMLPAAPVIVKNPLRLACTIIEFGRDTEDDA